PEQIIDTQILINNYINKKSDPNWSRFCFL
ncbi:MAG: hypothetical protein ACI8U0_000970, partial [Flavobacteriales bacterium]